MFESICFLITSKCNLSCSYCFRLYSKKGYIEINEYRKCLAALKAIGTKIINITGGEPLLHPLWKEFIILAKDFGFIVNLTTNTLLLDIEDEVLSKLDLLTISCDGFEIEGHRNRDSKQFEKSTNTIQSFNNNNKYSFSLKVNTVVTQTNINTLEQFAKSFLDNPSIVWMLFPYNRKGIYNDMPQNLEVDEVEFKNLLSRLNSSDLKCRIMIEHAINSLSDRNYILVNTDADLFFCTKETDYYLCNLIYDENYKAVEQANMFGLTYTFKDYTGEI